MNKTVIITGGARRIGRGLALQFAERSWNVGIIFNQSLSESVDTVNFINQHGVESLALKADVSNHIEIQSAIAEMAQHFGNVDVLVNNAAIYPERKSLYDLTLQAWDDTLNTNLRSVMSASQSFAKYASGEARIINIASLGAYQIWKQRLPYNVSKAGVIQLTKALALELAPYISVNSISPGTIEINNEPDETGSLIPVERIPMRRYGNTRDVFDGVYFFATCSMFITGQNLTIDGGFSL